jgi:hypothetical protein
MKYLKIYEDFNNKEKELEDMFNLVMGNTEVYKIPYSYYGTATKERRDFDIYVVSGTKQESDDHKLVQELYHNHEILNELLNLEFFHISLSKKYATVVLYDYVSSFNVTKNLRYANKNHLSSIYTSKLPLPQNIKSRLKFTKTSSRLLVRPDGDYLNRGIDWSDGHSSNIALFDRIYNPKEKVSESIDKREHRERKEELKKARNRAKDEFMGVIKDKLLELSDIGFNAYIEDSSSESLLGNMLRVTIVRNRGNRNFDFSECKDVVEDVILTNKDWFKNIGLSIESPLYEMFHLIISPETYKISSLKLDYNEKTGVFHPEGNPNPNLNYIGKIRRVELFFENFNGRYFG